jgi:hypothetical protein
MKANKRLMHLVLLFAIFGVLAFTASDYVGCHADFPDEFLDLAAACQNPVLPVFSPELNLHPCALKSLKVLHSPTIGPLNSILRC